MHLMVNFWIDTNQFSDCLVICRFFVELVRDADIVFCRLPIVVYESQMFCHFLTLSNFNVLGVL